MEPLINEPYGHHTEFRETEKPIATDANVSPEGILVGCRCYVCAAHPNVLLPGGGLGRWDRAPRFRWQAAFSTVDARR